MVHLNFDEHVSLDVPAKHMVIGAFCFFGFWIMAGFVAASLLSLTMN